MRLVLTATTTTTTATTTKLAWCWLLFLFLLRGAAGACSDNKLCLTCTSDCVWCQSTEDYFTGTCSDKGTTCDATTSFQAVDTYADSCPYQAKACTDCVGAKAYWGVWTESDSKLARCFTDQSNCESKAGSGNCISEGTACPTDATGSATAKGPTTPEATTTTTTTTVVPDDSTTTTTTSGGDDDDDGGNDDDTTTKSGGSTLTAPVTVIAAAALFASLSAL